MLDVAGKMEGQRNRYANHAAMANPIPATLGFMEGGAEDTLRRPKRL